MHAFETVVVRRMQRTGISCKEKLARHGDCPSLAVVCARREWMFGIYGGLFVETVGDFLGIHVVGALAEVEGV